MVLGRGKVFFGTVREFDYERWPERALVLDRQSGFYERLERQGRDSDLPDADRLQDHRYVLGTVVEGDCPLGVNHLPRCHGFGRHIKQPPRTIQ